MRMPGKIKMMLVEDEAMTAVLLKMNLETAGYDIVGPVATGEAAIDLASDEKPSVILMDIRLAGKIDGIEAVANILSFHNPYIIFMTGYSDEEIKARAKALNPAAYMVKPITPDSIETVISKLFSEKK